MYSQCLGKNKQGTPCRFDGDLDEQGFCKFHRVGSAQCRGTTRQGAQCKINWDLDNNGYCKHHHHQFRLHTPAMPTATVPSTPRQCCGTTARGTPCRIRFDLNEHGLCQYHQFQRLKRQSQRWCVAIQCDGTRCKVSCDLDPVTKLCAHHRTRGTTSITRVDRKDLERSSSTDPVLPPPVAPNPVHNVPTTARTTPTTPIALSTPSAEETMTAETKTEETKTKETKTEETKTEETASPNEPTATATATATDQPPPLWTVEYIVSTRTIVIRMYSEYSRLCHHDPLLLKVSRWGNVNETFVECVASMIRQVPVVGGFLAGFKQPVIDRIAAADRRKDILSDLTIADGGLFHSDGTLDSAHHELLEMLAKAAQPHVVLDDGSLGSNLARVENACLPIWVTDDERKTHDLERMKRQPPLDPSVWFRFERVAGRLLDDNRGATIHWELTKKGELIETGAAAVNEQVPVHNVTRSDLAQCVLEVQVRKKRRWLKDLTTVKRTIDLANVRVSVEERDSGGNDGPDLQPTKLPVGRGRVVHFRILAKP